MRFFSGLRDKLRDAYTGWRQTWVNRWRFRSWPDRIRMLVPIVLGVFLAVLSAGVVIWIAMWFFFGPPSVNIAGVMVDLDRSASLAGPDKNANGIRDDIDEYIKVLAEKKGYDAPQVRAIEQDARATQMLVTVDLSDAKAVRSAGNGLKSVGCLFYRLGADEGYMVSAQIEKMTANTKQRALAYIKFSHAMNGTVTTSLKIGEGCDK